jgi:hypothetical protein
MHLKPSEYVVKVFGGVRATARAIGRCPASVSKWSDKRKNRGCDGNIPSRAQRIILDIAKRKKMDITPSDLINGRLIKE